MKREILINCYWNEVRVAILENSQLVELLIERESDKHTFGNIYKGKVDNILPSLQAAFVNIGLPKNAFLHVSDAAANLSYYDDLFLDEKNNGKNQKHNKKKSRNHNQDLTIEDVLKRGQELLIQIKKEGISDKGAKITTNVTLPGRLLVYLPTLGHVGTSKRIYNKKERQRLKKIIGGIKKDKEGFIIRTMAQHASKSKLLKEVRFLRKLWYKIKKRYERLPAPALIYENPGIIYKVVRDLITPEVTKIWIDDKQKLDKLNRFVREFFPKFKNKTSYYSSKVPIFQSFKIEDQIESALKSNVKMKSGADLIFEQTESMTTIDVNSGSFRGARDFESFAFKINMEAAREIPKQLRLRDIGGIIVIDFIDMNIRENKKKVLNVLHKEFKKDKTFTKVYAFSPLGLVEMIRTRVKESLIKNLYTPCPTCKGSGRIPSPETMALSILRKLKTVILKSGDKNIMIKLNPSIIENLKEMSNFNDEIIELEQKYHKHIHLSPDPNLNPENINIVSFKHIV